VSRLADFPPKPAGLRGRSGELVTLARTIATTAPARVALVGAGGSGKSVLAAAVGHRLRRHFGGRVHWFRVGRWDWRTLLEMLALRFGTTRDSDALVGGVQSFLAAREQLVVLDNHEDDAATARLLELLGATPTTFVITARRCLLSGVLVFPVAAPLVTSGRSAFPRVGTLTRLLRWNPLALDIADAIVHSRAASAAVLERWLVDEGVARVRVIAHEDDLPEVALLVDWAWRRLDKAGRRLLTVLAHVEGDHMDLASLASLAGLAGGADAAPAALRALLRWRLVQEPLPHRYAVHAVVRYAVARRTTRLDPARVFDYYVRLLERHPERFRDEQTHLFAAMDQANRSGDLSSILRVDRLCERLAIAA
jgi:NB-ARC domain-containing protein